MEQRGMLSLVLNFLSKSRRRNDDDDDDDDDDDM